MKKELIVQLHTSFEQCMKAETDTGTTFWLARDLQGLLGYERWENFVKVIEKAKTACQTSGYDIADHFLETTKMVDLGSGAKREINTDRGIVPERLPPAEDIKKVERRVQSEEKKLLV